MYSTRYLFHKTVHDRTSLPAPFFFNKTYEELYRFFEPAMEEDHTTFTETLRKARRFMLLRFVGIPWYDWPVLAAQVRGFRRYHKHLHRASGKGSCPHPWPPVTPGMVARIRPQRQPLDGEPAAQEHGAEAALAEAAGLVPREKPPPT